MRTGFTGPASDHRALVRLRELDLAHAGIAAEALHLVDLLLALELLLAEHEAEEEEHDRDAQEEAAEVEGRAQDRAHEQDSEDGECDLHRGGSLFPWAGGRVVAVQLSVS